MGQAVSLALFIGVPLVQGAIGGMLTAKDVKDWFPTLKKPGWVPPNWAIGPLWSLFYTIAGVASSLIVKKGGFGAHAVPLSLYLAHFVFNFAWTPIFFKARNLGLAFADMLVMLGFTTLATIEYFKVNPVAGYLMASYVGWQCFVTALNYKIWRDNQTGGKEEKVSVPAGFPPAKRRLCTSGDATTTLLSDERSGESSRPTRTDVHVLELPDWEGTSHEGVYLEDVDHDGAHDGVVPIRASKQASMPRTDRFNFPVSAVVRNGRGVQRMLAAGSVVNRSIPRFRFGAAGGMFRSFVLKR